MPADARTFRPKTFAFLRDLAANNRRDWFQENRDRYEQNVRGPALQFIADFAPRLRRISAHFTADPRPVGGSLFRIHRDTRFAKDKSPYKTFVGIQFRHERCRDAHAPGFYLHLEPKNCFVGVGIWHPDTPTLRTLRAALHDDAAGWKRAAHTGRFRSHFELSGEALKRAPRDYDPDHPLIDDLRRKDFIGVCKLEQKAVLQTDFPAQLATLFRAGTPLVRFLCGALELDF